MKDFLSPVSIRESCLEDIFRRCVGTKLFPGVTVYPEHLLVSLTLLPPHRTVTSPFCIYSPVPWQVCCSRHCCQHRGHIGD